MLILTLALALTCGVQCGFEIDSKRRPGQLVGGVARVVRVVRVP
jgi:hypothetical protein